MARGRLRLRLRRRLRLRLRPTCGAALTRAWRVAGLVWFAAALAAPASLAAQAPSGAPAARGLLLIADGDDRCGASPWQRTIVGSMSLRPVEPASAGGRIGFVVGAATGFVVGGIIGGLIESVFADEGADTVGVTGLAIGGMAGAIAGGMLGRDVGERLSEDEEARFAPLPMPAGPPIGPRSGVAFRPIAPPSLCGA